MWELINDDELYADYDFYYMARDEVQTGFCIRLTIAKQEKKATVYIKGDSDEEPEIFISNAIEVPMDWAIIMAKSIYGRKVND